MKQRAWLIAALWLAAGSVPACAADAPPTSISQVAQATTATKTELMIVGLQDSEGEPLHSAKAQAIGLTSKLAVVLSGTDTLDASGYVLFLNGQPITDLDGTFFDAKLHALVFPLNRNAANASEWAVLLGSPTQLSRTVSVALGQKLPSGGPATPDITGPKGQRPVFSFTVLSGWRLVVALVVVIAMLGFVWGSAKRTAIIKDNWIPQIPAEHQTYSLGRWQMAVWFSLIFASYVFLYILLNDINTLNSQALMLMGISGATALAAIAVDAVKDTPQDTVNESLKALGIRTYQDVVRIRLERDARIAALKLPNDDVAKLNSEIQDRENLLQTYHDHIAPFETQGWRKDLATDQNGYALHRIQVVSWTLLLGAIFLYGVYSELTMPQFSATLLALMGISGAGYVGFKYPEAQQ